jgi:hypothetical protein
MNTVFSFRRGEDRPRFIKVDTGYSIWSTLAPSFVHFSTLW